MSDYGISVMYPADDIRLRVFADIIASLEAGILANGYDVAVHYGTPFAAGQNIVIGLHDFADFPLDAIPANSIIYNFEQVTAQSTLIHPRYVEALQHFAVWDYSERNIAELRSRYGIEHARHVPLGYMPCMSCLDPAYPRDIDVLFYGMLSPRRRKLLEELRRSGLRVEAHHALFAGDRDFALARSRLVLNLHYYTPGTLEVARINYVLANRRPVLSERNPDTYVPDGYETACFYAGYDEFVERALALLQDDAALAAQAEAGFKAFQAHSFAKILEEPLGGRSASPVAHASLPRRLNAGSGRDYRQDCLNIDISPEWQPDIVADLSAPLTDGVMRFSSARFGEFALPTDYFDDIFAYDVLEHVPDLPRTMANFLGLLREGGRLHINVPYDLSLGAWQDPTHVRAFNENSWFYYTTWAWYLGWREYRFDLEKLDFIRWGSKNQKKRKHRLFWPWKPKAPIRSLDVQFMRVILRKIPCSPEDRLEYDRNHRVYALKPGTLNIRL